MGLEMWLWQARYTKPLTEAEGGGSLCGRDSTQSLLKQLLRAWWPLGRGSLLLQTTYLSHRSYHSHHTSHLTLLISHHPSHTTHHTLLISLRGCMLSGRRSTLSFLKDLRAADRTALIIQPFISHDSSPTTHLKPFVTEHSSHNRSSRSTHHTTTHHTTLITQPRISHHSSHTTHHTALITQPLISHHSSHTTHRTPFITHHSSHSSHTTYPTTLISHYSSRSLKTYIKLKDTRLHMSYPVLLFLGVEKETVLLQTSLPVGAKTGKTAKFIARNAQEGAGLSGLPRAGKAADTGFRASGVKVFFVLFPFFGGVKGSPKKCFECSGWKLQSLMASRS